MTTYCNNPKQNEFMIKKSQQAKKFVGHGSLKTNAMKVLVKWMDKEGNTKIKHNSNYGYISGK